jgi:glycosyltransferase involved in cell wall biosynthesis
MNQSPHISICIPAYKRTGYLERLLGSIAMQTYKDYEVVITDDSPDDSVKEIIGKYSSIVSLRYFKNPMALGTPENWNEGIRRANGQWIKLMHDDDWFADEHALRHFHEATARHPRCPFFFSAFRNITEGTGNVQDVRCNAFDRFMLWLSPLHLFKKVYIGNPSCTLVRRDQGLFYDNRFKWVVDFEYYIRCLKHAKDYQYIDKYLLNIGFHEGQVTMGCFRVPEVEIPESHLLLDSLGWKILRNPVVFDYYWRLYRNLGIRSAEQLKQYDNRPVHPLVARMINFQKKISPSLLRNGVVSKTLMFLNYIFSSFSRVLSR